MKRVWLVDDAGALLNNDGTCRAAPHLVRAASVALAMHATGYPSGRNPGDPVFEEVTESRVSENEKRRKAGSPERVYYSCGDLANWVLTMLGCRDERLVNRTADGGEHPWNFMGARNNITMIAGCPQRRLHASFPQQLPGEGDVLFLDHAGGHVCVVQSWDDEAGMVHTEDYGQPYARSRARKLTRRSILHSRSGGIDRIYLDGSEVPWWLPIDMIPLHRAAIVPDSFVGGIPCEFSADVAFEKWRAP